MNLNARILVAAFAGMLFHVTPAGAQEHARSYAVLSLIGNAIHVDTVRASVGVRALGAAQHLGVVDVEAEPLQLAGAGRALRQGAAAGRPHADAEKVDLINCLLRDVVQAAMAPLLGK